MCLLGLVFVMLSLVKYVIKRVVVFSSAEPPCADGDGCGTRPVLRKTARLLVLQVHAGGRRQSYVWVLQVSVGDVLNAP